MTAWRLVASGSVLALVLTAPIVATAQSAPGTPTPTAGGTPTTAPTQDIGPLEKAANPVTPENPIPRRQYSVAPPYPSEAAGSGVTGTLTLKLTLDQSGRVGEARRTEMIFRPAPPPAAVVAAFTTSAVDAVRQWQYDTPVTPPISLFVRVSFVPDSESQIIWHDATLPVVAAPASESIPRPPSSVPGAVRVGGNVPAPRRIKNVAPVYPPIAQSARVSGIVIIQATIGADGRVIEAEVTRSIPLLDQAALDAVRQWEFVPTLLNGAPTPIIMSVTVNFQLDQ